MTTYTPPARLPAPELFEAAIVAGLARKQFVPYAYFTQDINAIDYAIKRLKKDFGIEIEWLRGPDAPLTLKPLEGMSIGGTLRYLFDLMRKWPHWKEHVVQGMRPNLTRLFDVADKEFHEAEKAAYHASLKSKD